jgi:hypothetical protein
VEYFFCSAPFFPERERPPAVKQAKEGEADEGREGELRTDKKGKLVIHDPAQILGICWV